MSSLRRWESPKAGSKWAAWYKHASGARRRSAGGDIPTYACYLESWDWMRWWRGKRRKESPRPSCKEDQLLEMGGEMASKRLGSRQCMQEEGGGRDIRNPPPNPSVVPLHWEWSLLPCQRPWLFWLVFWPVFTTPPPTPLVLATPIFWAFIMVFLPLCLEDSARFLIPFSVGLLFCSSFTSSSSK